MEFAGGSCALWKILKRSAPSTSASRSKRPISSLVGALRDAQQRNDVRGSLIVLPEAFNLRNGCWNSSRIIDATIAKSLQQGSLTFRVALVCGLIESAGEPFSSGFLVDGAVLELLTRKMGDDQSGNYRPYQAKFDRAILHRGVSIIALICMDAANQRTEMCERHTTLLAKVGAHGQVAAVMCIPARMGSHGTDVIASRWSAHLNVALANGISDLPSVIRLKGTGESTVVEGDQNAVVIRRLAD